MELPILLLKDALLQQKEQLSRAEKYLNREPKFKEFRQKGIDNLKSFIAELEEGINVLTIADKQKEALTITGVGNLLKDKESQTFEDWMEEHCVKLGKYYQYKFEDVLYTEEQLLQKYNTYKLSL